MKAINESIYASYTKKVLPKVSDVLVVEGPKVMKGTKSSVIAREKIEISAKLAQRDRAAEETIRKSHVNFIRTSTGERFDKLSAKARSIVSKGLAEGVGNDVIATDLKKHFKESIPRPSSYWRTVADSYVGRARTTSQIYSYEDASISSFEVVAILDEVTTDQCRFMDGKVFTVASARAMLDSLNDLDDPEDVRFANPWIRKGRAPDGSMRLFVPNADGTKTTIARIERSGMGKADDRGSYSNAKSNSELGKLGVPCPPFHGRCRTSVVASEESLATSKPPVMVPGADLQSPEPTPQQAPAVSPPEQLEVAEPPSKRLGDVGEKVFGRKISDRELDDLFGMQAELPKGMALKVTRVAEFADNESVSVMGAIKNEKGHVIASISRAYKRDDSGKTSAIHSSFVVDTEHQSKGLGRAVFNSQIDAYQRTGLIKTVELDAATAGRYVWTKAGFAWSAEDQATLFAQVKTKLVEMVGDKAAKKVMANVASPYDVARLVVDGQRVGKDLLMEYSQDIVTMSQTPKQIKRL